MLHKIAQELFSLPSENTTEPGTIFAAMDFNKTLELIVENCYSADFANAGKPNVEICVAIDGTRSGSRNFAFAGIKIPGSQSRENCFVLAMLQR